MRACILIDLSQSGAQIGLENPLAEKEGAVLRGAGLEEFGTVVRSDFGEGGGVVGLKFDQALSKQQVIDVRHFAENMAEGEVKQLRREVQNWVTGID